MKKKGFATSAILYTMLLLFLVALVGILNNLQNKKVILDALKEDTIKALQQDSIIDSVLDQIGIMNNKIVELEVKNQELESTINENKVDAHILKKYVSGINKFSFKTKWGEWGNTTDDRQSILLFGSVNGTSLNGMLTVFGNGATKWTGDGEITVTKLENGKITVNLSAVAYDLFLLISAEPISA